MSIESCSNASSTPGDAPLTLEEVRLRVKPKSIVLWPYRGAVEEGTVLSVYGDCVDLCWLEGYRSRNDTVQMADILSVHDPKGPEMYLRPFQGKGYFTEAGLKWKAAEKASA